ncbi:MAG: hypothetical protein AAGG68_08945 [Bacteroidota bacterium]
MIVEFSCAFKVLKGLLKTLNRVSTVIKLLKMKSLGILLFSLLIGLFSVNNENTDIDFKNLAEKYGVEYINSDVITTSKGEVAFISFPQKDGRFVDKSILMQGKEKALFNQNGKYEFIIFDDMLAIKSGNSTVIYKLKDQTLSEKFMNDFAGAEVKNIYGIGKRLLSSESIKFSSVGIENSSIGESVEYIATGEFVSDDASFGCGCNAGTTSCSRSQSGNSCAVTCAADYYACCKQGWTSPSCNCVPTGGGDQ